MKEKFTFARVHRLVREPVGVGVLGAWHPLDVTWSNRPHQVAASAPAASCPGA